MKTHKQLYQRLCSKENIELAFRKARKRKSLKPYVIEFEKNLQKNLEKLRKELISDNYNPKPLRTFIVREPKTRKIRKSYFVDRVVHHAVCNILEPIYEKRFIYDSYANRKGKGTIKAIQRFDSFKLKSSRNNTRKCYVLKADIKHYFDEVSHDILIKILERRIKDNQMISLISKILKNHSNNVGMPLGNMTSQFFANLYLNELDQYVKHKLKAKYYIRYVDDFMILHEDRRILQDYKDSINKFLKDKLRLELHPNKSKILLLNCGIPFLGFRNYKYHRLLRKSNIRIIKRKIIQEQDYDSLSMYLEGWFPYAKQANTYHLRKDIAAEIESNFPGNISLMHIDRLAKLAKV